MRRFVKYMHPLIKHPYVLVTHNGDEEIPGEYAFLLDDKKIISWCGINATLSHPKIVPLALGTGNPGKNAFFENAVAHLQAHPLPKKHLCYLNIGVTTHPDRPEIKRYFSTLPFCTVEDPRPPEDYLKELMQSKFTISPRGNGIDCCRVWESLLVGTIPLLKTTPLDPLYHDLPVVIVNDWKEVTRGFLERKYEELSKREYNFEKCYAPYWLKSVEARTHKNASHSPLLTTSRVSTFPKAPDHLRSLFWQ